MNKCLQTVKCSQTGTFTLCIPKKSFTSFIRDFLLLWAKTKVNFVIK